MTRLQWGNDNERLFETGVSNGVLYDKLTGDGFVWNGLVSISESSDGGTASPVYYDGQKVMDLVGNEDYKASLVAYGAPEVFFQYDGGREIAKGLIATQQPRRMFGLSYKTLIGDPIVGVARGYKLHVVYNCTVSPSTKTYSTINDAPEPPTVSWEIDTVPYSEGVTTYKPTAHLIIDSRKADPAKLKLVEDKLYGTASTNPTLITPSQLMTTLGT